MAKNLIKNSEPALDITANIAFAAAFRRPKAVLSTLPEVINLCHTVKGLYVGKMCKILSNR